MGLDAYMYQTSKKAHVSDFEVNRDFVRTEIAYWRKNYELNNFMETLYNKKGGSGYFNMRVLVLNKDDINKILKQPFITELDAKTFQKSLSIIKDGGLVFYWSWE